ncbi:MAG TPA: DUF2934 domain-containing protein, partial [Gammaproteobacteria bacterium]|nr:DUF2934 domain-containing protein [Gammaproteobacteria bacterium]
MSKVTEEQRRQMIAEAAYFRAERRGFGGDSVGDWIEAESEIDDRLRQIDQKYLLASLDEGIAVATKKVSAMKRKASTAAASARANLQRDVEQLVTLRDFVRAKAKELRDEGTRAGELAFHQAERACHDLADAL